MNKKSIRELRGPRVEAPNDPSYHDAKAIRERFTARSLEYGPYSTGVTWPNRIYPIGRVRAEAYSSDKWQKTDFWEDYKHIAEGPQFIYATDVAFRARPELRYHLNGDRVAGDPIDAKMPRVIAEGAPVIFLQIRLFHSEGQFAQKGDEGYRRLDMPGSVWYAGYAMPKSGHGRKKFFLTVIDRNEGVHFIIVGTKLEITKDGIVGLWDRTLAHPTRTRRPRSFSSWRRSRPRPCSRTRRCPSWRWRARSCFTGSGWLARRRLRGERCRGSS